MKKITTPYLVLIAFVWLGLMILLFYLAFHVYKEPLFIIFASLTMTFGTLLFVHKVLFKYTNSSFINNERKQMSKQRKLTEKELKNVGMMLADPNFDFDAYAARVDSFISLAERAQEAELRMKERHITSTVNSLMHS